MTDKLAGGRLTGKLAGGRAAARHNVFEPMSHCIDVSKRASPAGTVRSVTSYDAGRLVYSNDVISEIRINF